MEEETEEDRNNRQFEALIQGLLQDQFGQCDDFMDTETVTGLREKMLFLHEEGELKRAGIGKAATHRKNERIRGDFISWLDNASADPFEMMYLRKIEAFILYLNKTCFTALNDHESHYANYPTNSFYKRHKDQFLSDSQRKFSVVMYLNDNWLPEDKGTLALYLDGGKQQEILPIGGRIVFFRSDEIEHEVHPSHTRNRMSIAGWLKGA